MIITMKKTFALIALFALLLPMAAADEGMWIPMLLGRNQAAMQKAGMRITAQDIYDINNACLKDAVILFNQGCTGEFVSDQGLFLTNHHCGYYYITSNSTVEHDYLTHGFWAMTREQEIPCKGLTATRLVRMEEVTNRVLAGISDKTSEEERERIVKQNIAIITTEAVAGTHYKAVIKPFYYGNQYFMYINEVFTDVRLVGAPPSNIGKFGGDTDNWMWPRHTGDFSMFRVYVGADGKPAPYSKDNVPLHPKRYAKVSVDGYQQGDYCMTIGYPGSTSRYLSSMGIQQRMEEDGERVAETLPLLPHGGKYQHGKTQMPHHGGKTLQHGGETARQIDAPGYSGKACCGFGIAELHPQVCEQIHQVVDKQKQEHLDAPMTYAVGDSGLTASLLSQQAAEAEKAACLLKEACCKRSICSIQPYITLNNFASWKNHYHKCM